MPNDIVILVGIGGMAFLGAACGGFVGAWAYLFLRRPVQDPEHDRAADLQPVRVAAPPVASTIKPEQAIAFVPPPSVSSKPNPLEEHSRRESIPVTAALGVEPPVSSVPAPSAFNEEPRPVGQPDVDTGALLDIWRACRDGYEINVSVVQQQLKERGFGATAYSGESAGFNSAVIVVRERSSGWLLPDFNRNIGEVANWFNMPAGTRRNARIGELVELAVLNVEHSTMNLVAKGMVHQ